jgi:putative nucleotidyltransferase with HDIG domain
MTPAELVVQLQRDLARGTSDLPALPRGVAEALRLARTPSIDFDEVERVASSDPPLAARVISVANSAMYARSGMGRLASVRRASVRLGAQATRDVLYQVAYASMFVDAPRFRDLIEATFEHGVRAARTARLLAKELGLDADLAFLAGLLHDIGRARCWKLLAKSHETFDASTGAAAVEELHASAGAELATAWHLPEEVVESCLWHHAAGNRPYPTLIAAADATARFDEGRGSEDERLLRLIDAGVSSDRLPEVMKLAAEMARFGG